MSLVLVKLCKKDRTESVSPVESVRQRRCTVHSSSAHFDAQEQGMKGNASMVAWI